MVERFGPLPPERLVFLLRQACRSLAEAHENGLVHRDIKPANLFVAVLGGEYDFLKVLDFGMVKTGPEDQDVQLTAGGSLVGTPAFVAPEWVTGEGPTDGRADLYSLGCTAFWILTGMPVFQAKTPAAMLLAHVNSEPPPVSRFSEQRIPRRARGDYPPVSGETSGGAPGVCHRALGAAGRDRLRRRVGRGPRAGVVAHARSRDRIARSVGAAPAPGRGLAADERVALDFRISRRSRERRRASSANPSPSGSSIAR